MLTKPTKEIAFNYNWNKKLYAHFFTTIRLTNYSKYHVGDVFKIMLKNTYAFDAILTKIVYCKINELPEITCFLDTGYNKAETIKTLQTMYANKNINWDTQLLSIILLENLQWDKPQ